MKRVSVAVLAALLPYAAIAAGVTEVKLKLPLKPKLQITGDEKIAIAPFVIANREKKNDRASKVDVQAEFQRYLKKQLTKSTKLRLVDVPQTRLPGSGHESAGGEPRLLEEPRRVRQEPTTSSPASSTSTSTTSRATRPKSMCRRPTDGTYYRQVLVETTGFVFDIDIAVFNADTGEKVLEDNFRDFKEFDQRNYDEILGLFENLRSMETQLVGIFVPQETSATRYVFTE